MDIPNKNFQCCVLVRMMYYPTPEVRLLGKQCFVCRETCGQTELPLQRFQKCDLMGLDKLT